jgi:hypothetical protein
MASKIESLLKVILPKRSNPKGVGVTSTYNSSSTENVLSAPTYKDHLTDVFTSRSSDDSRKLIQDLITQDPDVSAAVNAFLTVANTEPLIVVRTADGLPDREGQKTINQFLLALTTRFDYSKGFQLPQSIRSISENFRYMVLMRGGIGAELILEKTFMPTEIRHVDLATINWYEKEVGKFIPEQTPENDSVKVLLDIPTFFVSYFRRDPTKIYTNSPFVSAINTVAARQQVINDLYRIMQLTGYPRLEITVVEEILTKNAPSTVRADAVKLKQYISTQMATIRSSVANIRPDQAFVHTDSVKAGIMNDKNPGTTMNIDSIISTLNAQNQAGLRTMATILGRGESGVNTASVEARIFSMNAEEINEPVAEIWSQILTMAVRLHGHEDSYVDFRFRPVEMRPHLELEPQKVMKAARLKEDLSLGIITDDEYHLDLYGRLRPDSSPELSGTGFMSGGEEAGVDVTKITPNSDPLGKSLAPKGSKGASSNNVKKVK